MHKEKKYYVSKKDIKPEHIKGHYSYRLLDEKNGCVAGCSCGISVYTDNEYVVFGIHNDQEGFFVIEGTGKAKVGNEEFKIGPEVSFIAPACVEHSIKKDADSEPIKLFWFHSAI